MHRRPTTLVISNALLAFLLTALSACATTGEEKVADKLETPKFILLQESGNFQLRRYAPFLVASTIVQGDFDSASRDGFRRIADFIFGNNVPNSKIAMTAPVSAEPSTNDTQNGKSIAMTAPVSAEPASNGAQDSWRITFTMPSEYTRATLPEPKNSEVQIEEQPERCVGSIQFSGFTTKSSIAQRTAELRTWMKLKNLAEAGEPIIQRYDDPFTLPWNRTNEIHIPVQECEER